MRVLSALSLVLVLMTAPAMAQEADMPWQATVSGQIDAMRAGNSAAALELAGAGFKANYTDPDRFLADIERAGYAPIASARSYVLGNFREIGPDRVVQAVTFTGTDQSIHEAVYDLVNEPDTGWRVRSVVMRKRAAIAI